MNTFQKAGTLTATFFIVLFFEIGFSSELKADDQIWSSQKGAAKGISSNQDNLSNNVEPQDKLDIQVRGEKDLSGVFTVSREGEIDYALLGSIHVQGLSLVQIKKVLTDSLGEKYLVSPDVEVTFSETPHRMPKEALVSNSKPAVTVAEITARSDSNGFFEGSPSAPVGIPISNSVPTKIVVGAVKGAEVKPEAVKTELAVHRHDAGMSISDSDIIDSGDKLNIQVYKEPDLTGIFSVDNSGKINYPLLGAIYVQSLSLDDLQQLLRDMLNEKYLANPQLDVTFSESPTKSVSVIGQVLRPGNYILTRRLTLFKLISQIGGFTSNAATNTIRIVRTHDDGKKETIEVNVDKVMQGYAEDVSLRRGDIIFVDSRSKEEEKKGISKSYITVLGQVGRPGNYIFSPNLTLVRLIGEAGGFTPVAATGRIKIVRHSKEGKLISFFVDAGSIMGGSKDVDLAEGDLIVVPESYF